MQLVNYSWSFYNIDISMEKFYYELFQLLINQDTLSNFFIKAFGELALLYNCARTATVKGELGFLINKIKFFLL